MNSLRISTIRNNRFAQIQNVRKRGKSKIAGIGALKIQITLNVKVKHLFGGITAIVIVGNGGLAIRNIYEFTPKATKKTEKRICVIICVNIGKGKMLTETKFSYIDLTIYVLLSILMLQFEKFKAFSVIK